MGHSNALKVASNVFPDGIIVADNVAVDYNGKVYGEMLYQLFMIKPSTRLEQVLTLQAHAATRRVLQVFDNSCGPDTDPNPQHGYHRRLSMAGFLIGACKYSYYGCSVAWVVTNTSNHLCWYNEYNQPLGAPLGKFKRAMQDRITYIYRKFTSGTTVYLDIGPKGKNTKSCICWGMPTKGSPLSVVLVVVTVRKCNWISPMSIEEIWQRGKMMDVLKFSFLLINKQLYFDLFSFIPSNKTSSGDTRRWVFLFTKNKLKKKERINVTMISLHEIHRCSWYDKS